MTVPVYICLFHCKSLHKNIILGNVYRPPRDNTNNYRTFIDEITPLLTYLKSCNSEVIIAGDCNINLLKVNKIELFSEFCDVLSTRFYPKITLPTRFSNSKGTLIDNFFCKLSNATMTTTSGILIKKSFQIISPILHA